MKKHFRFIFSAVNILSLFACHQKPAGENTPSAEKAQDTVVFYPVNDFLKDQIKIVDSTPFYIYKISIRNGKKDSSKISKEAFDLLAALFVKSDISNLAIKKKYKESVFDDVSTDSYTFNYSTKDTAMFIQSIDILLDKEKQTVKRIFMTCFEEEKDSAVSLKLGWKPYRNFYINRIIDLPDGKEITEQNMIVWDERE